MTVINGLCGSKLYCHTQSHWQSLCGFGQVKEHLQNVAIVFFGRISSADLLASHEMFDGRDRRVELLIWKGIREYSGRLAGSQEPDIALVGLRPHPDAR